MGYGKVTFRGVFSDNSDYSDPDSDTRQIEFTTTSDVYKSGEVEAQTAAAITVYDHSVEAWTSIDAIIVQNVGTTNDVLVGFTDTAGTPVAITPAIDGGKGIAVIGATAADVTLQAVSAASVVRYFILGTK